MKVNCFRLNEARRLEPVATNVILEGQSGAACDYWIDIEVTDPEAVRKFLEPLGVESAILEGCTDQSPSRLIESFETGFCIRIPMSLGSEDKRTHNLSIVCVPNLLVSISDHSLPALQELARNLMTHVQLHAASTASLLHHILGTIFEENVFQGLNTRNKAEELESALDDDTDMVEMRELLLLKKQVGRFYRIFQEQGFIVAFLQQVDSSTFRVDDQRIHYRDLAREIQHAVHGTENLDARLRDMHQHCQLAAQEKTNKKLSILTIIQAIFVPLTLIAGIYGMNFQYMPELQLSYGYWLILAVMGGVAVVELWVFWRLGWFD